MKQSRPPSFHSKKSSSPPSLLQDSLSLLQSFETDFIYEPIFDHKSEKPQKSRKLRSNVCLKSYQDGSRYEGEMVNVQRNGKGVYYYSNGDKYFGEWENDLFHGKGGKYYFDMYIFFFFK